MHIQNHAPIDYRCPCCLMATGRFPDEIVYSTADDIIFQNEHILAIISSHQWPNNLGNTLIIPNDHYENIYTLPPGLAMPIQAAAQAVALAMKAAFNCHGVSTRQHNEPAGNQDVWHYHLHVTPRYDGDNLYGTLYQRALMLPQQRADLAERIREHLPAMD